MSAPVTMFYKNTKNELIDRNSDIEMTMKFYVPKQNQDTKSKILKLYCKNLFVISEILHSFNNCLCPPVFDAFPCSWMHLVKYKPNIRHPYVMFSKNQN